MDTERVGPGHEEDSEGLHATLRDYSRRDTGNELAERTKKRHSAYHGPTRLCGIARSHRRPDDPGQLSRALGFDQSTPISKTGLTYGAREIELKATVASFRSGSPVETGLSHGESGVDHHPAAEWGVHSSILLFNHGACR
jgi:hypothetical protein